MDILFQASGNADTVVLSKDFIVIDRPRMTSLLPVRLVQYIGYPKQWDAHSSVQLFVGTQEHNLYMNADEAKEFVDLLLGLLASE